MSDIYNIISNQRNKLCLADSTAYNTNAMPLPREFAYDVL